MVSKLVNEKQDQTTWEDVLPTAMIEYNSSKNDITGETPHSLMYGVNPRLPVDMALQLSEDEPELEWLYKVSQESKLIKAKILKQKLEAKARYDKYAR